MNFVSAMAARSRRLALAGLMLLVLAAAPIGASAHYLGGKWSYGGGVLLPLSYQNNTGAFPAYSSAVTQGASNWYYTPTPSDLYSTAGSGNVTLSTFSDSGASYWAVTRIWASHTTCTWFFCWTSNDEIPYGAYTSPASLGSGWGNYASSTIAFNRYTMDGLTAAMKTKVATHEFGHAQGLGHAYSPNCTSIMQQGFLSFNTPQPHDSYDFDQLYPGYWTAPYAC
ncbi:MAG TPA: hypothetical protein VGM69_00310 [Chloroflexota bacterium]